MSGEAEATIVEPVGGVRHGPLLALAGYAIAAFSAMCGIGGGIFGVPILHYLFGLPLKAAVATSLCLVATSTTMATASELVHPDGALFFSLILVLVATSLVGAQIGFWISKRMRVRALKGVFCLTLAFAGARILLATGDSAAIPPSPVPGFDASLGQHGFVALVGLAAGIVVPLLGVGGGLVVVPCLLFGLPAMGYLGARATSMAMGMVTSSRSIWLYMKSGLIDWALARWFASGALLGAVTGVWLVHLHGAAEVGQILLAITLCVAAVRFGVDFARGEDARSSA